MFINDYLYSPSFDPNFAKFCEILHYKVTSIFDWILWFIYNFCTAEISGPYKYNKYSDVPVFPWLATLEKARSPWDLKCILYTETPLSLQTIAHIIFKLDLIVSATTTFSWFSSSSMFLFSMSL